MEQPTKQCSGVTLKGLRCTIGAKANGYCGKHQEQRIKKYIEQLHELRVESNKLPSKETKKELIDRLLRIKAPTGKL